MPSAKIGKQAAAYPPGYRVPSLVRLAVYAPAARSRAFRRFFWGRPVSRWRTYIVGSFFHVLVRRLGESDFSFLTTVSEDAELTMFTMGTYRGREGWRKPSRRGGRLLRPAVRARGHECSCLSCQERSRRGFQFPGCSEVAS